MQSCGEQRARFDGEFLVGVPQVALDRVDRHEQCLGDVGIGHPAGG